MSKIKDYINNLLDIYGDKISFIKSTYDENTLLLVPVALREFYAEYSKINFPFGHINTIEDSLKKSQHEPFKNNLWFPFGFDGYFSFWLCYLKPDKDNLFFTSWDHSGGNDIGEAWAGNIIEFLEDTRMEYEENKDNYKWI